MIYGPYLGQQMTTMLENMSQPEVSLGINSGWGGTQRLPRLIGNGKARYILYSGEIINVATALEWGMVVFVVPAEELMEKAMTVAKSIAKQSAFAVRRLSVAVFVVPIALCRLALTWKLRLLAFVLASMIKKSVCRRSSKKAKSKPFLDG